jgi:hypothetical protein
MNFFRAMNSRVISLSIEMVVLKKMMKGMVEITLEDGEDLIENIRKKWDEAPGGSISRVHPVIR